MKTKRSVLLTKIALSLVLAYGLLLALLVLLSVLIEPWCQKHKVDLEQLLQQKSGLTTQIDSLAVTWHTLNPCLVLDDLVFTTPQEHNLVAHIKRAKIRVGIIASIWQRRLVLHGIGLTGVDLQIIPDAKQATDIPGLDKMHKVQAGFGTDITHFVALVPQITVHDLHLNIVDKQLTPIAIPQLKFQYNGRFNLSGFLSLDNQHTNLAFKVQCAGAVPDYHKTSGQAVLQLKSGNWTELAQLLEQYHWYPSGWHLNSGQGAIKLNLQWLDGNLVSALADIDVADINAHHSDATAASIFVNKLIGQCSWHGNQQEQVIKGSNIQLTLPSGSWPRNSFVLKLAQVGDTWHVHNINIDYVKLQDLLPLASKIERIPGSLFDYIKHTNVQGELANVVLAWHKSGDFHDLVGSGKASALSWQAYRQLPGVDNLSGTWQFQHGTMQVNLASHNIKLLAPLWFTEPRVLSKLEGIVSLIDQQDSYVVRSDLLLVNDQDINGSSKFTLVFPKNQQENLEIDWSAKFNIEHLNHVTSYIPVPLRANYYPWLRQALSSGSLIDAEAMVKGSMMQSLNDLKPQREVKLQSKRRVNNLHIKAHGTIQNMDLHYSTSLPVLHAATGTIALDNESLQVDLPAGDIANLALKDIVAGLSFKPGAEPFLQLNFLLSGDMAHADNILRDTQLANTPWYQLFRAHHRIAGPFALNLKLQLLFAHPEVLNLTGVLSAHDNKIMVVGNDHDAEGVPLASDLSAEVKFAHNSIIDAKITGKLLNQDASLSIITKPENHALLTKALLITQLNLEQLAQLYGINLHNMIVGTSKYRVSGKFMVGAATLDGDVPHAEVTLSTDLLGTKINLPGLYNKDDEHAVDMLNLYFRYNGSDRYRLRFVQDDQELLMLKLLYNQEYQLLDIESKNLTGYCLLKNILSNERKISANFDKFVIPPLATNAVGNHAAIAKTSTATGSNALAGSVLPSLPSITMNVKQVIYHDKNLGHLQAHLAINEQALTVDEFHLKAPDYNLTANGLWQYAANKHKLKVNGRLHSERMNKLLARLQISLNNMVLTAGSAQFDFTWLAPPYALSLDNMAGQFSFYLDHGRVVNLNHNSNQKIDLGRIISLFSLQTIPRRLNLDFSDLLQRGYSFDFIKGSVKLQNSNAYTINPIVLNGPVANLSARGRIGLLAKDYDLVVNIEPQLTASIPVVAGALTLNPLVGAAAWLVNKAVLNKQVSKFTTYKYQITGPWDDPVWQELSTAAH